MFEVSEIIYQILSADATLTGLQINVQPLISSEEDEYPLVNYSVSELAGETKDGLYPYNIAIQIYTNGYNEGLQIADAVKNAIGSSTVKGFRYNGTTTQVNAYGEYYIESNYQFKK